MSTTETFTPMTIIVKPVRMAGEPALCRDCRKRIVGQSQCGPAMDRMCRDCSLKTTTRLPLNTTAWATGSGFTYQLRQPSTSARSDGAVPRALHLNAYDRAVSIVRARSRERFEAAS